MSAPLGSLLGGGAMPLRILSGTWNAEKAAQPRCGNSPAGVLQQVGDHRRGEHSGRHEDHREDAAVAEKREPERPEKSACRVEDVAGLARVQAKRLEAVVKVQ